MAENVEGFEPTRLSQTEANKSDVSIVQRAENVWRILAQHSELTQWDLMCFSVQYIAALSVDPIYMSLRHIAKGLTFLLYEIEKE